MRSCAQNTHIQTNKQKPNKHAARTALLVAFGVRLFQERLITTIKNHFEYSNNLYRKSRFSSYKKSATLFRLRALYITEILESLIFNITKPSVVG